MRTFVLVLSLILLTLFCGCGTSPTDPLIEEEGVVIGVLSPIPTTWEIISFGPTYISYYWVGDISMPMTPQKGTAQGTEIQKICFLGKKVTKISMLFFACAPMTVILYNNKHEVHRVNVVKGTTTITWDF